MTEKVKGLKGFFTTPNFIHYRNKRDPFYRIGTKIDAYVSDQMFDKDEFFEKKSTFLKMRARSLCLFIPLPLPWMDRVALFFFPILVLLEAVSLININSIVSQKDKIYIKSVQHENPNKGLSKKNWINLNNVPLDAVNWNL